MAALRRKSDDEWIDAVNFLEPWWGKPPTNQPPVEEDHKRLKYAFWILKLLFYGRISSRDQNLKIDYANWQAIFLCAYISNFNTIRPKMAGICTFEFWKLPFLGSHDATWHDQKLEIDYSNLQTIFLCTFISDFKTIRPKLAEICVFEFWKLTFFGSCDVAWPKFRNWLREFTSHIFMQLYFKFQ